MIVSWEQRDLLLLETEGKQVSLKLSIARVEARFTNGNHGRSWAVRFAFYWIIIKLSVELFDESGMHRDLLL